MTSQTPTSLHKQQLAERVAEQTELTKTKAMEVITVFTDQVSAAMARGESVALTGFGAFSVRERQARTGRNPSTGEPITIAAHKTVGFRPGKTLKDSLS